MTEYRVFCSGGGHHHPSRFPPIIVAEDGSLSERREWRARTPWPKGSKIEGLEDGEPVEGDAPDKFLDQKASHCTIVDGTENWGWKCPRGSCGVDVQLRGDNLRRVLQVTDTRDGLDIYLLAKRRVK